MHKKLLVGHDKFRAEFVRHDRELYQALASGVHAPMALVISCCDARVVPDVILDADPGDLFVVRNIANLVPQMGTGHHRSVGAAIEYAIHGLKVPHVIVCGHTQCGGLRALTNGIGPLVGHMPSLAEWLHDAVELRERLGQLMLETPDAVAEQIVYENVAVQLENLLTYPAVRWGLERGVLEIHGWVYDLADGSLSVYDPDSNEFGPLDRE